MKRLMSILVIAAMLVAAVNVQISASAVKIKKPSKVSIKSIQTVSTNAIRLSWKKVKKAKGYQIKLAANKNLTKGKKTININKNKKAKTIKDLKSGTKYYVKVRAYTKRSGKKIYGKWSKIKSAYTKQKKVKKIKKKNKGPHALPETVEDYEPGYIPDSNYVEQEPTTQPTTQSRTLTAEEIETNLETLRGYAEIIKSKVLKGNYYKLNNGENGRQIYSSSWWKNLCENDKWADENLYGDNLDVVSWSIVQWENVLEDFYCFANDIPCRSYTRDSNIYYGVTIDLNEYPEIQEFFRSNPANITDDMTDIEKLKAIATYISKHGNVISSEARYGNDSTYYTDYPELIKYGVEIISLYRVLLKDGNGVCADFSYACAFWAGYYDISCVFIQSNDMDHAWNRAILRDENGIEGWYEVDAHPRAAAVHGCNPHKVGFDITSNMYGEVDAFLRTVPITLMNK